MKKYIGILCLAFALTIGSGSFNDVQAQKKEKKGWSRKAKGAAIGGAAGAVTGAAVSKKDKKGAVVGGVVGAGAGYLYGRHKDKKKDRRGIDKN
jgi:uncharacterized membrane protein YfcA